MANVFQYYTCKKCRFRTTLLSRINEHLQVHDGTTQPSYFDCFHRPKLLKCTSCIYHTESLILLRYHLIHNHFTLKATLKTCKMCAFRTYSNYLWIIHCTSGTCKGKKRVRVLKKCKKCDFRTFYAHSVKQHLINKHTPLEEIDWQQCQKCPAKFKTLDGLKQHHGRAHVSIADQLHCKECDYSTPIRNRLALHFNRKHALPEEIKWVQCYECGAKFKDNILLKSHLKTHVIIKKTMYKCDQCLFTTHHKKGLKRHVILRHLSESLEFVQCSYCPFKTKRNDTLKTHIGRFHDDSAFKCDLCDYRAKYINKIQHHKKIKHEVGDVKWFKCEYCDHRSKYKDNLKTHVLAKHNVDGEVFQCKECDYNTRTKHYLSDHIMRVHKRPKVKKVLIPNIICENCSFITTTKTLLKRHIFNKHTVHTENEKLKCAYCTYFCFSKQYMANHLKFKHQIGDNIRWYKCDKCDYKNQKKSNLVSHVNNVHNDGILLECDQCIYNTRCPRTMQSHKKEHRMNVTVTLVA